MYTGIVETTGRVRRNERTGDGRRLRVGTGDLPVPERGDSVAVSGVCLTATATGDGWFEADCSAETISRTYLAALTPDDRVNLERPMAADGRFHGHVVKGTVDTTARVRAVTRTPEEWRVAVELPDHIAPYVVERGAVAVDGASLTVADRDDETFSLSLVPTTRRLTTFSELTVGDRVHLEADVLAKYVAQSRASA